MSRRRWSNLALGVIAAATSVVPFGCGEECASEEARCEDGVAMTCVWREGVAEWESEPCRDPTFCVVQATTMIRFEPGSRRPKDTVPLGKRAICVLGKSAACATAMDRDLQDQSPLADPAVDTLEITITCDGTDLVHCDGEWETRRVSCVSCDWTSYYPCGHGKCTSDADCAAGLVCYDSNCVHSIDSL